MLATVAHSQGIGLISGILLYQGPETHVLVLRPDTGQRLENEADPKRLDFEHTVISNWMRL